MMNNPQETRIDVQDYLPYLRFSSIHFHPATILRRSQLVVAGDNHLIFTGNVINNRATNEHEAKELDGIIIEFESHGESATFIKCISDEIICVGFESGMVACFDHQGEELFTFKGIESPAQAVQTTFDKSGLRLWFLHEDATLMTIPLKQAASKKFDDFIQLRLASTESAYDFIMVESRVDTDDDFFSLNNKQDSNPKHKLIVAGYNSSLSIYEVDLNKLIENSYASRSSSKGKSGGMLKSIYSMFNSMLIDTSMKKTEGDANEQLLFTAKEELIDEKRRILRIIADPIQRFAALADSLGRVTLLDIGCDRILRIWKGLRNAKVGWLATNDEKKRFRCNEDNINSNELGEFSQKSVDESLLLAIYAPLLGLVSIYNVPHGSCLKVVPVGLNCQLVASFSGIQPMSFENNMERTKFRSELYIVRYTEAMKALDVIPITATVASELELEEMAMLLIDSDNADIEDKDLRYSDMRSSIQEVIQREQRNRKAGGVTCAPLTTGQELRKMMLLWSTTMKDLNGLLNKYQQGRDLNHQLLQHSVQKYKQQLDHTEKRILMLLGKIDSVQSFVSSIAAIEYLELTNIVPTLSEASNEIHFITENINEIFVAVSNISNQNLLHSFTLEFHNKVNDMLKKITKQSKMSKGEDHLLNLVKLEGIVRSKLFKGFSLLKQNHSAKSNSSFGFEVMNNYAAAQRDETVSICKQNNFRAEALCWVLRASKKEQQNGPSLLVDNPILLSNMNPINTSQTENNLQSSARMLSISSSLTGGGTLELFKESSLASSIGTSGSFDNNNNMPGIQVGHSANKKLLRMKVQGSNTSVGSGSNSVLENSDRFSPSPNGLRTNRNLDSSTPDHNKRSSKSQMSLNASDLGSFSLFRLFFRFLNKSILEHSGDSLDLQYKIQFQAKKIRQCLQCVDEDSRQKNSSSDTYSHDRSGVLISCSNFIALNQYIRKNNLEDQQSKSPASIFKISPTNCNFMLELIFKPLFGDLVNMHNFSSALKQLNMSDPIVLRQLLPLFVLSLSQQPMATLISDVLTKKMSTSPIQRWLRDHLLTFQGNYSSYMSAASKHQGNDGENSLLSTLKDVNQPDASDEDIAMGKFVHELQQGAKLQSDNDVTASGKVDRVAASNNVSVRYDDCVRFMFREAWKQCRDVQNLEAVLAWSAIVLETFYTVHDQIERRTLGVETLRSTIVTWENLAKQIRVLLLIRSRISNFTVLDCDSAVPVTIQNISKGRLSLFRILANDTLSFALRADQAKEHETQCFEVYRKRLMMSNADNKGNVTAQPADEQQPEVLLAWGKVADKRWRDIVHIAVAEDGLEKDKTPKHENNKVNTMSEQQRRRRKRKPLLLYFPHHNNTDFLGAYRSIILAERWSKQVNSMESLALTCEHLFELPSLSRAVVAAEIYSNQVLPAIQILIHLEEDDVKLLSVMPTEVKSQVLAIIAEIPHMNSLIRLTTEILNFILEVRRHVSASQQSSEHTENKPDNNGFPHMNKSLELSSLGTSLTTQDRDCYTHDELQSKLITMLDEEQDQTAKEVDDDFIDELPQPIWPPQIDTRLYRAYSCFNDQKRQFFSTEAVHYHTALLWTMQLRFLCGLRGVKLSELLGVAVHRLNDSIHELAPTQLNELRLNANQDTTTTKTITEKRVAFIQQAFRRIVGQSTGVSIVYSLAHSWGFKHDLARLYHINALILRPHLLSQENSRTSSANTDEEIAHILPQFEDKDLMIDALINAMRWRIGRVIEIMDKQPVYGPMVASLDGEAAAWSRAHVRYQPFASVVETQYSNQQQTKVKVNFEEIGSTRQLVIYIQSLLLAVPIKSRNSTPHNQDESNGRVAADGVNSIDMPRYRSWLERKSRCDALLQLCNTLTPIARK